jgi:hypothetical protein
MSFILFPLVLIAGFITYKYLKFAGFKRRIISQLVEEGFTIPEATHAYNIEYSSIAKMHHDGFSDFYIVVSLRKTYKPEIVDADWREEKYQQEANRVWFGD